MQLRVVVIDDFMDLPEVQLVPLQPLQRPFQLLYRYFLVTTMGAYLGHEEDFVAPSGERAGQPVLGLAGVILPPGVEEVDSIVDGLVDDVHDLFDRVGIAQVVPAQAQRQDLHAGFAQRASGNHILTVSESFGTPLAALGPGEEFPKAPVRFTPSGFEPLPRGSSAGGTGDGAFCSAGGGTPAV